MIPELLVLCHSNTSTVFAQTLYEFELCKTGWADIGLTQQGKDQAVAAGRAIKLAAETGILPSKELKIHNLEGHMNKGHFPAIDVAFCSLLKRASDTMNLILNEVHLAEPSKFHSDEYQYHIPVIESWRLNERH